MLRTWARKVFSYELRRTIPSSQGRRFKKKHIVPSLERLEERNCPVMLTVGPNVNISQLRDNQAEETIAIDPSNPQRLFASSMNWHGGNVGKGLGLYASYTTLGGSAGSWTGRIMATGFQGGDSLPMAQGQPRAAFDSFGNLYLTYITMSVLQDGTTTGGNAGAILNDTTKSWSPDQWKNMVVIAGLEQKTIIGNTPTQLVLDSAWVNPPAAGTDYLIRTVQEQASTITVVQSTDGGQTFTFLAFLAIGAVDRPTIATGPGGMVAAGSVWVVWNQGGVTARGAPVSGLGVIGNFISPKVTGSGLPSPFGESIAVGPNGQVLVSFQTDYELPPPPKSKIWTALAPDGLGPLPFNFQIQASDTLVGFNYPIPASVDKPINANVRLAWDRSGGVHNGRVYLVYTDSTGSGSTDTDIIERYSDDNGTTWSATPVRVNNDTGVNSQFFPSVAVDQTTGNVAVIWYDARNDPGNAKVQIYGTASGDGGNTFAANVQIGAALSSGPDANRHMLGVATSASTDDFTLNDSTQNWALNWWTAHVPREGTGFQVHITSGTGAGQIRQISSNSPTQLVVTSAWAIRPSTDSVYKIELLYNGPLVGFDFGDYTDLAFHNGKFYPAWADNSNSTADDPDGTDKALDTYTAAITVTTGPSGPGSGGSAFGSDIQTDTLGGARAFATAPIVPGQDRSGLSWITTPVAAISYLSVPLLPLLAPANVEQLFAAIDRDGPKLVLPGLRHNTLDLIDQPWEGMAASKESSLLEWQTS